MHLTDGTKQKEETEPGCAAYQVKLLLQLLISVIDAKLLEAIHVKGFETETELNGLKCSAKDRHVLRTSQLQILSPPHFKMLVRVSGVNIRAAYRGQQPGTSTAPQTPVSNFASANPFQRK